MIAFKLRKLFVCDIFGSLINFYESLKAAQAVTIKGLKGRTFVESLLNVWLRCFWDSRIIEELEELAVTLLLFK